LVAHLHFFATHRPTLKKSKRATKPTHHDSSKMDRHSDNGRRSTTGNSGFKKLAVQWLIEHLCFVSSSVLADSFVLRNRQLLKPAKRKAKFSNKKEHGECKNVHKLLKHGRRRRKRGNYKDKGFDP
jgi:hypothetical protein